MDVERVVSEEKMPRYLKGKITVIRIQNGDFGD
jgi:hypothetical protein